MRSKALNFNRFLTSVCLLITVLTIHCFQYFGGVCVTNCFCVCILLLALLCVSYLWILHSFGFSNSYLENSFLHDE